MNFLPLSAPFLRTEKTRALGWQAVASAGVCLVALLWSYWTTLTAMADRWASDPQYSHGFLVPVFALIVLWSRKDFFRRARWEPSLLGLPVLLAGVAIRLFGI